MSAVYGKINEQCAKWQQQECKDNKFTPPLVHPFNNNNSLYPHVEYNAV